MSDGGGLSLRVHPNGSKYWQFRYRFAGRERGPLSLGKYPEVRLEEAREKRQEARKLLREDIDPSLEKKKRKLIAEQEFREDFEGFAREWIEFKERHVTRQHARKTLLRLQKHIFPLLGRRPIASIEPLDVLAAIRKVEENGSTDLSRRLMQICGAIFRYAVQTGRLMHSPTVSLAGALAPHRVRHYPTLEARDLPGFLAAFENLGCSVLNKFALRFLLLTGVRTGEMRHARWEEID
ncbi:MAG: integrase arm-type DNA-binding domain-containing protein, partial [Verrucomicrobiota bacterium]